MESCGISAFSGNESVSTVARRCVRFFSCRSCNLSFLFSLNSCARLCEAIVVGYGIAELARTTPVHDFNGYGTTVCPATHVSRLALFAFRFLRSGGVLAAHALVGRAPVQRKGCSRAQNEGDRACEIICSIVRKRQFTFVFLLRDL